MVVGLGRGGSLGQRLRLVLEEEMLMAGLNWQRTE